MLDDSELLQLQPAILVSDSEDERVAPLRFSRLAMLAEEVDLDPPESRLTEDLCHSDDLLQDEEGSEDDTLSPIRGDESPHRRWAKLVLGRRQPAASTWCSAVASCSQEDAVEVATFLMHLAP